MRALLICFFVFVCCLLCAALLLFAAVRVISYCREIHREGPLQPDEAGSIPDLTSVLGADLKVNPSSGKSDLTVGIKHSRHSYNYHAAINTEPRVEFTADFEPLAGAPVRLGMCASVPYTGKAEDVASFGISMTLQL